MEKKRVIKKFEQLTSELLTLVNQEYPDGFEEDVVTFQLPSGELARGIPLETEEARYLIRLPKSAIADDDDDDGVVKSEGENFESLDNLEIADDSGESEDD